MKDPVLLFLVFLFGISFGSFINVLVYRLPLGESLIKPPSKCPHCGTAIKFYDNIPLISYAVLRGRCRSCEARISLRYPLVEILAGLSVTFAIYSFGFTFRGVEAAVLSLALLAIFFIDLDCTIIPNAITYPGIVLGLLLSLVPGTMIGWKQSLIGMAVGGAAFLLVGFLGEIIFKKEALGFGDVKYAAMVGAFLGWKNLLLMLVIASFLGSVVGIALILAGGKKKKSTYIPFGPFLTVGAWISIYFGETIIRAYLNLVGL
jgi:leader peptidase (prepilin peptidase)/N-methyltransferase